jgi:2-phosphosulfolactate phosphatase
MDFSIHSLQDCSEAQGLCVVIDVLRAFTTAAYAFSSGAKAIILVSTKEEAFEKFQDDPSLILLGEEHALPISGFHFGNSPFQIQHEDFADRVLVQRTSAGTQGVVACAHSNTMLLASFVVAEATIRHIQHLAPSHVSFIVTGSQNGDEDRAFAEYAQERLRRNDTSIEPYLERVKNSPCGQMFSNGMRQELAKEDLELALLANRFSFAMEVSKSGRDCVARRVHVTPPSQAPLG